MANANKAVRILSLVGLFFVSFIFFLYFTFPYGVLKEAITAPINKNSDFNVRIGNLDPKFPLGVHAEDVLVFTDKGRKDLKIHNIDISLSILRLLIGRLHFNVDVGSKNGGELNLGLSFGIWALLTGGANIPAISLESDNFAIDGILDFALSSLGTSPNISPLLQPLLNQILLTGNLNGSADIDLDMSDPQTSSGELDLSISGASLIIEDPAMNIAPQNFSRFVARGKMENGSLIIDKASGLTSQEMKIDLDGKVSFNKVIEASPIDVNLAVELKDGLQENFALIIELAMGGKGGRGKVRFAGTIGNPDIIKM